MPPPLRQVLTHEAMTTAFKITVVHEDPAYARQAVAAAFEELDRIESRLSRYIEGSDVFRINRLAIGEAARVHPDTFDCLRIALDMQAQTNGALDVTYASAATTALGPKLALEPDQLVVRALIEGLQVDLGGIGKGFALDRLAGLLREWDVTAILLAASTSTLLAIDPPPDSEGWPIRIGPDHDSRPFSLAHSAVSGSGTRVKGNHIFDPRSHQPAHRRLGAWSAAPTGSVSDALSTAFMVLDASAVRDYCHAHPGVAGYLWESETAPLQEFRRENGN